MKELASLSICLRLGDFHYEISLSQDFSHFLIFNIFVKTQLMKLAESIKLV